MRHARNAAFLVFVLTVLLSPWLAGTTTLASEWEKPEMCYLAQCYCPPEGGGTIYCYDYVACDQFCDDAAWACRWSCDGHILSYDCNRNQEQTPYSAYCVCDMNNR